MSEREEVWMTGHEVLPKTDADEKVPCMSVSLGRSRVGVSVPTTNHKQILVSQERIGEQRLSREGVMAKGMDRGSKIEGKGGRRF